MVRNSFSKEGSPRWSKRTERVSLTISPVPVLSVLKRSRLMLVPQYYDIDPESSVMPVQICDFLCKTMVTKLLKSPKKKAPPANCT